MLSSVFVPLRRMPLNPNGKIDKPALPFPDTAEAASAPVPKSTSSLSPTEQSISQIWAKLLPSPPVSIPIDESFFDLGGHSILATRLIFELRKTFIVEAPLGLVFDYPTIKQQAKEIDTLRDPNFGLAQDPSNKSASATSTTTPISGIKAAMTSALDDYGADLDRIISGLDPSYPSQRWTSPSSNGKGLVIFLTGATGFLGSYILKEMLSRPENIISRVICLVRAKSANDANARLKQSLLDRGIAWSDEWTEKGRVQAFRGDLGEERFGLSETEWEKLEDSADVIVHNGAMVGILSSLLTARSNYSSLFNVVGALDLSVP